MSVLVHRICKACGRRFSFQAYTTVKPSSWPVKCEGCRNKR